MVEWKYLIRIDDSSGYVINVAWLLEYNTFIFLYFASSIIIHVPYQRLFCGHQTHFFPTNEMQTIFKSARMFTRRTLSTKAPKTNTSTNDFISLSSKSTGLLLASGALLLGYFYNEKQTLETLRENSKNSTFGKPLVGGPFNLVDHHGNHVSNETFLGKYMLLYFGYTVIFTNTSFVPMFAQKSWKRWLK
jgi:hypothetical protein